MRKSEGKVLHSIKKRRASLLLSLLILAVASASQQPLFLNHIEKVEAAPNVPYGVGNYTYVNKPALPQNITKGQISIGSNWTYIYPLVANKTYHIYCYGDWVDVNGTNPQTDYDIYVFDPSRKLVSYHTEAAGLPEHLGTTVKDPYFVPAKTGNYSFQIVNDPRESNGSEAATFMVIEHIETNLWYLRYMEGEVKSVEVRNTTWAYEFTTSAQRLNIRIRVPDTLDMYEARLYLMASPNQSIGTTLNGVPLPEEAFLYGNYTGNYGGYNLNQPGFRFPDRIASCEYAGEYMEINYTATVGETLYHLVLIAENGTGNLQFLVKTDFNSPTLSLVNPPANLIPNQATKIQAEAVDNESGISRLLLNYTTNNWATRVSTSMVRLPSGVYEGQIPGLAAGTNVKYRVQAFDLVDNNAVANGSCTVKYPTTLTCRVSTSTFPIGQSVTASGTINRGGVSLHLIYKTTGKTVDKTVSANATGYFNYTYTPTIVGAWSVQASWGGNATCLAGVSSMVNFTVQLGVSSMDISVSPENMEPWKIVTVSGFLNPSLSSRHVTVTFIGPDGSYEEQYATTGSDGSFSVTFTTGKEGQWIVQGIFSGDSLYKACSSSTDSFTVSKSILQLLTSPPYLYVLIGGIGAAAVVGFFLYRRYFRGEEEEEEEE
jgi:hypothetical protein